MYADLLVDVADMRVDRMGRDDQFAGNTISGIALRKQSEYLGFAVG